MLVIQLVALTCCSIDAKAADSETAYVQTDRTTYIAGEPAFYKLYILDSATRKRSDISKYGYIILRAPNLDPVLKIKVKVNAGIAYGSITLPDTLTSGVYQIVAFTGLMRNYGEKQFFYKEIVIANRFDKEVDFKITNSTSVEIGKSQQTDRIQITTNKLIYSPCEKVIVRLGKTNSKANVVVSVFEESKILSTGRSIAATSNEFSVKYLPESIGKIIRGRVIDKTTQKNVQAAIVLLSCIDTIANLQYATTNSDGMFQMLLNEYYDEKVLFFTIKDVPDNKQWKIEIEDDYALSGKWKPELMFNSGNSKEFIVKSQNIFYINKSYQLNNELNEVNIADKKPVCPQFYHYPSTTILPSDFVPLNDFPEISVEILPMVKLFKNNDKYRAHVVNSSSNLFKDNGPAIFLDGVYVDDIDKIIGLGSEKIKKIDVIDTERIFGDLIFQGVISILTKSNEISNTIPSSNSLRLENPNINIGKRFVAVNPNSVQNSHIPFFRQLLYWNPNLELNGIDSTDIEFYTSDNTANFIIEVKGISEDGTPVSGWSSIKINNQINVADK